jgi:hypothetical protein
MSDEPKCENKQCIYQAKLEYPEEIIQEIKSDPEIKSYYDNDFVVTFDKKSQSLVKLLEEKVFELQSGYENMAGFNLDYCEVGFCCDNCTFDRYEHLLGGEEDAFF